MEERTLANFTLELAKQHEYGKLLGASQPNKKLLITS